MESLKIIKTIDEFFVPGNEWKKIEVSQNQRVDYLGFNVTSLDVDANRQSTCQVIAAFEKKLSSQEIVARKTLGVFAMIFSLGLAWLSADVRDCFSDKATLRFAVPNAWIPNVKYNCLVQGSPKKIKNVRNIVLLDFFAKIFKGKKERSKYLSYVIWPLLKINDQANLTKEDFDEDMLSLLEDLVSKGLDLQGNIQEHRPVRMQGTDSWQNIKVWTGLREPKKLGLFFLEMLIELVVRDTPDLFLGNATTKTLDSAAAPYRKVMELLMKHTDPSAIELQALEEDILKNLKDLNAEKIQALPKDAITSFVEGLKFAVTEKSKAREVFNGCQDFNSDLGNMNKDIAQIIAEKLFALSR